MENSLEDGNTRDEERQIRESRGILSVKTRNNWQQKMKVSNLSQMYTYLSIWYFLSSNYYRNWKNITFILIHFYFGICLQRKDKFPLWGMDFLFYGSLMTFLRVFWKIVCHRLKNPYPLGDDNKELCSPQVKGLVLSLESDSLGSMLITTV